MAFQPGEGWTASGWTEDCGISLFTLDWLDCGEPPRCLPWIGNGWTAFCVEQIYTLSWVCCDIIIGEPPPTGGGHPVRVKKPKLFGEDIEYEGEIIVAKINLVTEKGEIPEAAVTYQLEIDRFEEAIEIIEVKKQSLNAEINYLKNSVDIDAKLRREFLIKDAEKVTEFQLELISQVEILKIIRRRRQDEEIMIAMLYANDPDMSIIVS